MKCAHCLVEFHPKKVIHGLTEDKEGQWAIEEFYCPNPDCNRVNFYLVNGRFQILNGQWHLYYKAGNAEDIKSRVIIRPKSISRTPIPTVVPDPIKEDYLEACLVLYDSPKASAALSRRCLQQLLILSAGVKKRDLFDQIQEVLDSKKLPPLLAQSIDAIRSIGNFAAHPSKNTSTGEIVPVEPNEAEWNLEVLEMLFDHYYVQPDLAQKKIDKLNIKLGTMGKPPIR